MTGSPALTSARLHDRLSSSISIISGGFRYVIRPLRPVCASSPSRCLYSAARSSSLWRRQLSQDGGSTFISSLPSLRFRRVSLIAAKSFQSIKSGCIPACSKACCKYKVRFVPGLPNRPICLILSAWHSSIQCHHTHPALRLQKHPPPWAASQAPPPFPRAHNDNGYPVS